MADHRVPHASNGAPKATSDKQEDTDQVQHEDEGVCFTTGVQGAPFGAGVIHAYLAAGRYAPRIVAGISVGAITSAAFQRAFRECQKNPGSVDARWQWYRRYLRAISEKPFEVIWSGIPDQSDFFAEFIPVKDPVPETILDSAMREKFMHGELQARRDLTLFVKLGHWLSRMPLKVGSVADFVIQYVRMKEKYGHSRFRRVLGFLYTLLKILFVPIFHNAFHPMFIKEASFGQKNKRPVITFLATILMLIPPVLLLGTALQYDPAGPALVPLIGAIGVTVFAFLVLWWSNRNSRPLLGWPLYGACMSISLAILMGGLSIFAWTIKALAQYLSDSTDNTLADWIGDFFTHINGYLLGAIQKAFTLLFLVLFLATLALFIEVVAKARSHQKSESNGALSQPYNKLLQLVFKPRVWTWVALGFAILALGIYIAGFLSKAFAAWLRTLALQQWFHDIVAGLKIFAGGVSFLIDKAYYYKRSVIVVATVIFLVYLLKKGQPLTASEADGQRSARRRLRPTAFTLPLPLTLTFWIKQLIVPFSVTTAAFIFIKGSRGIRMALAALSIVILVLIIENLLKELQLRLAPAIRKWLGFLANAVFGNLNLHKALVHNYYLRLALYDLFQEDDREPILKDDPFPAVLVAAPLQVVKVDRRDLGAYQVWANEGSSLLDALTTTVALPGLYEPAHLERDDAESKKTGTGAEEKVGLDAWSLTDKIKARIDELDVCDGGVIRQNPIPALFRFIAQDSEQGKQLASHLSGPKHQPKLHVVYSVPMEPREPDKRDCNVNIVDVGLAALKLSRRRDTQLEVHQTNLLSQMEQQLRTLGISQTRINPIFADEIAPDDDPVFKNPLNPTRDEVLNHVAAGCRATLQVLYVEDLAQLGHSSGAETISCANLMKRVSRRKDQQQEFPGLPEVCLACTKLLKAPRLEHGKAVRKVVNTWSALLEENDEPANRQSTNPTLPLQIDAEPQAALDPVHPKSDVDLDGTRPRIVFVASGGVFRGTFHGGMIAALLTARIKPDLVVGASVGTIMGSALAAAFCAPNHSDAVDAIEDLTSVLLSVDKEIAFTKPFKNATRDLGIRARNITISPNAIRKMVLSGSRSDAAFAAVGAPSALIDSISHLLLIPHKWTANIAAEFIAGHVTAATKRLLKQLKQETLKRLNIENALIGTSLIQPTANRLLMVDGLDLKSIQPFRKKGIAVYGTTVDFWRQRPVLLGVKTKDRGPLYDFVEAALSSSAFPCVFSPRRESDLYPGTGSPTTLFSDGGMFDNLPFLPAIEILSKAQVKKIEEEKATTGENRGAIDVSLDALGRRWEQPDLLLAGALDINLQQQQKLNNTFDNIVQITRRASALQNNVKIKSFEQVMMALDEQIGLLAKHAPKHPARGTLDHRFLDRVVNASVLPVYPADPEHLNGTFAFCASTGLDKGRLKDSIANGCFQTFKALTDPDAASDFASSDMAAEGRESSPLQRTFRALKGCGKMPDIEWQTDAVSIPPHRTGDQQKTEEQTTPRAGECKFFRCSSFSGEWPSVKPRGTVQNFTCPFYQAADQIDVEIAKLKSDSAEYLRQSKQREHDNHKLAKEIAKEIKKWWFDSGIAIEDFARRQFKRADYTETLARLKTAGGAHIQELEKRASAIQEIADRLSNEISKHKSDVRSSIQKMKQRRDSVREIHGRCITDEVHIRAHDEAKIATKAAPPSLPSPSPTQPHPLAKSVTGNQPSPEEASSRFP